MGWGWLSDNDVLSSIRLNRKKSLQHIQSLDFPPYPGWLGIGVSWLGMWSASTVFLDFLTLILNLLLLFTLIFKVLCQWLMDQVPIGNKAPRLGYARQIWCPACRGLLVNPLALTSGHVLLECMVVEGTLIGNSSFYNLSRYKNSWRDQVFPRWVC